MSSAEAERLAALRESMVGADVPVALLKWMETMEAEVARIERRLSSVAQTARNADATASLMRPIG